MAVLLDDIVQPVLNVLELYPAFLTFFYRLLALIAFIRSLFGLICLTLRGLLLKIKLLRLQAVVLLALIHVLIWPSLLSIPTPFLLRRQHLPTHIPQKLILTPQMISILYHTYPLLFGNLICHVGRCHLKVATHCLVSFVGIADCKDVFLS